MATENTNLIPVEKPTATPKVTVITSPNALRHLVAQETENRQILTEFIAKNMKRGVDFGQINMGSRMSKECLFKPGAEKFASLLKLTTHYRKDTDTWEMNGSEAGTFCYICELVNAKGQVVGEGRGAASVKEKGNVNTAIKMAEKRAKIDAVLSTGGLSDFFTQDLDEMMPGPDAPEAPKVTVANVPTGRVTLDQLTDMVELAKEKGLTNDQVSSYIELAFKKAHSTELTQDEAKRLKAWIESYDAKTEATLAGLRTN